MENATNNVTNNVFETMIKHPFATAMLVACIANGVSNIIAAARGVSPTPVVSVMSNIKK